MSEVEVFPVPEAWAKRARMDAAGYEAACRRVEEDPEGYWREVASRLTWSKPFTQVKDVFKRPRPYLRDAGAICVDRSRELDESPDYPSGHATWGFANALILAEMAPERSAEVLARGRAFGESRVVCGVHSPSAVEAGRTNAAALVAALHASPDFRADFEAARAEVVAARARGLADAGACAAEAELVAKAPY